MEPSHIMNAPSIFKGSDTILSPESCASLNIALTNTYPNFCSCNAPKAKSQLATRQHLLRKRLGTKRRIWWMDGYDTSIAWRVDHLLTYRIALEEELHAKLVKAQHARRTKRGRLKWIMDQTWRKSSRQEDWGYGCARVNMQVSFVSHC